MGFKNFFGKLLSTERGLSKTDGIIEISGEWTKSLWKADLPVKVSKLPNIVDFLSQDMLPYLWPDIEGYVNSVKSKDNPQDLLRQSWAASYLNHPDPKIVLDTLNALKKQNISLDSLGIMETISVLINHANALISTTTADLIFSGNIRLNYIINFVLESYDYEFGVDIIVPLLRKRCPSDKKEEFEIFISDYYEVLIPTKDPSQVALFIHKYVTESHCFCGSGFEMKSHESPYFTGKSNAIGICSRCGLERAFVFRFQ